MPDNFIEIACKLSEKLECGLDKKTVAVAVTMLDKYPQISPESLAYVISELPRAIEKRKSFRISGCRRDG